MKNNFLFSCIHVLCKYKVWKPKKYGYKMAKVLFEKGNTLAVGKGRPPNQFDKKTLMQKSITSQEFDALFTLIKRKAMGEDVIIDLAAAKLIIDCVPVAKPGKYIVSKSLKGIKTEEHVDLAMEDTLNQVGDGEMSIEDGIDVATLIEKRGITILNKEIRELDEEEMRDSEDGQ
jgi:hypothetical protein